MNDLARGIAIRCGGPIPADLIPPRREALSSLQQIEEVLTLDVIPARYAIVRSDTGAAFWQVFGEAAYLLSLARADPRPDGAEPDMVAVIRFDIRPLAASPSFRPVFDALVTRVLRAVALLDAGEEASEPGVIVKRLADFEAYPVPE